MSRASRTPAQSHRRRFGAAHIEHLRRIAGDLLPPQFAEVVRRTPQPFLQPIYDLKPDTIVHGRVALLGDAAFVARPMWARAC